MWSESLMEAAWKCGGEGKIISKSVIDINTVV
jgi:hypothetical protein